MHCYIYALLCPITGIPRYVGKANDLRRRYKAHTNKARDTGTHKRNWIEKLKKNGHKPIMIVLERCSTGEWVARESWWIRFFKKRGYCEMNFTAGGDGTTIGNQTSFKAGNGAVPVLMIDPESGNIIMEFESTKAAVAHIGTKIDAALDNIGRSAKGLIWMRKSFYENVGIHEIEKWVEAHSKRLFRLPNSGQFKKQPPKPEKMYKPPRPKGKRVMQLDCKTGELLGIYYSVTWAAKFVGAKQSSISNCLNGTSKYSKKYKWLYLD